MMKSSKARQKSASASPSRVPPACATDQSKVMPAAATDSAEAGKSRGDWGQLSFRAPAAVEEFAMMLCVKRKVTFQTLALELLRNVGAPVSDADLQDNRKGRKATGAGCHASQAKSAPIAPGHEAMAALEQLHDPRLWERIAQLGNGQSSGRLPGTLQVIFANFASEGR
jgi:hypothetical protein